jgi:hypothetical protein
VAKAGFRAPGRNRQMGLKLGWCPRYGDSLDGFPRVTISKMDQMRTVQRGWAEFRELHTTPRKFLRKNRSGSADCYSGESTPIQSWPERSRESKAIEAYQQPALGFTRPRAVSAKHSSGEKTRQLSTSVGKRSKAKRVGCKPLLDGILASCKSLFCYL